MRSRATYFIAIVAAACFRAYSEEPDSDRDVVAKVHAESSLLYSNLESFVCQERIERYRGYRGQTRGEYIDTITSKVSFESGTERYTEVFQNRAQRPSISSISGAWSEGEYGTLLRQTRDLIESKPVRLEERSTIDGEPALVYSFPVDVNSTPWDLDIKRAHYPVPFITRIWVDSENGRVLKIERRSTEIDPRSGIAEIDWSVRLQPVSVSGRQHLLPVAGRYSVSYADTGYREWNEISFADYHRYGAEASLRFDPPNQ